MSRPTFQEHALRNWNWAAGLAAFGLGWLLEWLSLRYIVPAAKNYFWGSNDNWTAFLIGHSFWVTASNWTIIFFIGCVFYGAEEISELVSAALPGDWYRSERRQQRMVFAIRGCIVGWLLPCPTWLERFGWTGATSVATFAFLAAWCVATRRYLSDQEWIHLHRQHVAVDLIPGRCDELGQKVFEASTRWNGSVMASEELLRKGGVDPARFAKGARVHSGYLEWWLSENSRRGDLKVEEDSKGAVLGLPGPSGLFTVTDKEGNYAWVEAGMLRRLGVL